MDSFPRSNTHSLTGSLSPFPPSPPPVPPSSPQGEMGANILVGLQIRPTDMAEFEAAVSRLGYDFSNETNNEALAMFMQ